MNLKTSAEVINDIISKWRKNSNYKYSQNICFCQKKLFWKYLQFEFLRHLLRTYIIDNFSWCFQIHILLVGTISPLHFPYRILTELINDSQIALYFWFLAPLCILPGIEQTWHAPLLPALLNRQHAARFCVRAQRKGVRARTVMRARGGHHQVHHHQATFSKRTPPSLTFIPIK